MKEENIEMTTPKDVKVIEFQVATIVDNDDEEISNLEFDSMKQILDQRKNEI